MSTLSWGQGVPACLLASPVCSRPNTFLEYNLITHSLWIWGFHVFLSLAQFGLLLHRSFPVPALLPCVTTCDLSLPRHVADPTRSGQSLPFAELTPSGCLCLRGAPFASLFILTLSCHRGKASAYHTEASPPCSYHFESGSISSH